MERDERQGMRDHIRACLLLLAVLAASRVAVALELPEGARLAAALDSGDPRVELSLLVDATAVRPGERVAVGVLFEMDPGWHIYWRNPGSMGRATRLDWTVVGGQVGPVQWPAPSVFLESRGISPAATYGYEGQVLLWSQATFESVAPGDTRAEVLQGEVREVLVRVEVDFVTCHVGCIPGHGSLQRKLSLGPESRPADPETRALFARYRERLPVTPEDLGLRAEVVYSQSGIRPGDVFAAAISLACSDSARWAGSCQVYHSGAEQLAGAFIPDVDDWVELEVTAYGVHPEADGAFVLNLSGRAMPIEAEGDFRLRGLIPLVAAGAPRAYAEVDLPLPRAPRGAEVSPTPSLLLEAPALEAEEPRTVRLLYALALAVLGGLVLNLMPCVLPVLAIKVFHLAELAHRSRRETLAHGGAYAAGVLLTMFGLAVGVVVLRAAGTAVGWGFQFQQPLFVATISTLLLVFALNLFGVFEIGLDAGALAGVGGGARGWRRSLFEGLLAVVLATPCTAPFLGTAVGFAFASSTAVIFAIFLAIGVGLAAPYVLVTLIPTWSRIIPRPGPWMLQVRRALGFALIATLVWLLWVMGRLVGIDGQTNLSAYLVAVAFLTWIFGVLQAQGRARVVGWIFVALGLVVLLELPFSLPPGAAPAEGAEARSAVSGSEWRRYDKAAIRAELEAGRPVFVDFTADWCITCKVNERAMIADKRVQNEFARLDVATFRADFTRYDEEIRTELARFGRAGVPLYLLYRPEMPSQPAVLPELLTVDILLKALGRIERSPESGVGVP
jgi:thiol:disulfide interchange protein/DsbC/DsbD-like thiol-disulfide interchange protein